MHEDLVAFKNAFFEENKTLRGWMKAWWATQGWNAMVPSEQRKFSLAMRAALKAGKSGRTCMQGRASQVLVEDCGDSCQEAQAWRGANMLE